jgi:WNK lysine deficient protein kinase
MGDNREQKEVERSPDGRYIRFPVKLGDGAYKAVWLGYDTELGIEVAWCLVETRRIPQRERARIRSETEILSHLHHNHIINFYQVWENPETEQVCNNMHFISSHYFQIVFTTERVTSGSLKSYINRVKPLRLKVIKKWCRQILKGLEYLHSQTPPVIHRDLSTITHLHWFSYILENQNVTTYLLTETMEN